MKHASDTNLSAGLGGDCFISISKLFPSFAFCFIPLLFIVGIRYNEATLQPLIRGGLLKPFFVVAFLLFALHVLLQCSVLFKPPLQVYNFTLRRFKVFLLHFAAITAAVCCLLFSLCLLLLLFLIAMQRYKHICNPPNKKPKIFVFLTFYNK